MIARRLHIVTADNVDGATFTSLYVGTSYADAVTAFNAGVVAGNLYTYVRLFQFPGERKRKVPPSYTITCTQTTGGTIASNKAVAVSNTSAVITASPGSGKHLVSWVINGEGVAKGAGNTTTIANVLSNTTVSAVFAAD
jgi:hypothetical protein